jgi:flagellar biosynthesis/type III secretory pathway M-ring protein FliF/YscJ
LKIFVPSLLQRYSLQILAAGVSVGIAFMIFTFIVRRQIRLRSMAMKTERRKERRLGAAEQKAFDLANKKKKST